jgi:hypothetical protein
MVWLEMSRYPVHGGGDWGFSQSLWSPNGGYLSEVHDELGGLLLGPDFVGADSSTRPPYISVVTAEQVCEVTRTGCSTFFGRRARNGG